MPRSIDIDIDVHRAIENGRQDFEESPNAILRRLLGIDPRRPIEGTQPRLRAPRSSGAYSVVVQSVAVEANSLKELLRRVLLLCDDRKPGLLDALGTLTTKRGRHIVAKRPEDLYPHTPHLVEFAEKLKDGWWYDGNIGRGQLDSYLKIVAQLARLPSIPRVGKRSEKTTMTLEELGL